MKANELMIGDWVVYHGDTEYTSPVRIEGMDILTNALITEDREDVGFDGIDPIPLTAEILEKNGLKKRNRYQWEYRDGYCKIVVSIAPQIEIGEETLGTPPIDVKIEGALFELNRTDDWYVNELQHALKLCGIEKEIEL